MLIYVQSIWSEAMKSLRRNLIRTVLTILGLVVGIAAFICVVGVGRAGSAKVEHELQKLGDNMIWIEAGSRATNGVRFGTRETSSLTVEDARAIFAEIPGLKRMSPNVDGRVQVVYGTQNWNTTYRGVAPEYFDIRRSEIQTGTIFTNDDVERDVPVCLLGQTVVESLFPTEDPVGKSIRVQAMPCRVIGVFQPKGASASGWDQDDFVAMPYTTAMKRIGGTSWLDDIFFSATSRSAIPIATRRSCGEPTRPGANSRTLPANPGRSASLAPPAASSTTAMAALQDSASSCMITPRPARPGPAAGRPPGAAWRAASHG